MATAAAPVRLHTEPRLNQADLIAELRHAAEVVETGQPATRRAVRQVLATLLEEQGPASPYAHTLLAVIAALGL